MAVQGAKGKHRHQKSSLIAATNGQTAGYSLVALSRQIENGVIAAFHLCAVASVYSRRGFRSATTGNQASGGARD
jgi:hypothetical protein